MSRQMLHSNILAGLVSAFDSSVGGFLFYGPLLSGSLTKLAFGIGFDKSIFSPTPTLEG